MSLFPIYCYEEGDELPEKGNYYVIGKNGIFLHKDTGIVRALVKVDRIPDPGRSRYAHFDESAEDSARDSVPGPGVLPPGLVSVQG